MIPDIRYGILVLICKTGELHLEFLRTLFEYGIQIHLKQVLVLNKCKSKCHYYQT